MGEEPSETASAPGAASRVPARPSWGERRARRWLLVLMAAAVAVLLSSSAHAGGGPSRFAYLGEGPEPPGSEGCRSETPAEHCESWVDPGAALMDFVHSLRPRFDEAFEGRFSGMIWVDDPRDPQRTQCVGVVNPTPADHAAFQVLTGGNPKVGLVPVAYSWGDLEAIKLRVLDTLRAHAPRPNGYFAWVAPEGQRVVVNIRTIDGATLTELNRQFPADALSVFVVPNLELILTHQARTDSPRTKAAWGSGWGSSRRRGKLNDLSRALCGSRYRVSA